MLEDAAGNLRALLDQAANDPEFSQIELSIGLNEVYGSLNKAWNGRELTDEQATRLSEADFYRLRCFPTSEIIMDGS